MSALGALVCFLPGCSSGNFGTAGPQLRVLDASPDAPAIDIYQGTDVLAYNLGFGTLTSYVSLAPGTYNLSAHTAGSSQQLTSSRATFASAAQYTLLIGSTAGTMQQTILRDQVTPAPAGQVALRFLHQAIHAGPLDLYLVPSGSRSTAVSPLLGKVAFGSNSGYLNIAAGTYSLMAFSAGVTPGPGMTPVLTGPSVTYSSTLGKTLILLDAPGPASAQALQIVMTTDFDPAAAGT